MLGGGGYEEIPRPREQLEIINTQAQDYYHEGSAPPGSTSDTSPTESIFDRNESIQKIPCNAFIITLDLTSDI